MNVSPHITSGELYELFHLKYGDPQETGWSPRLRLKFDYYQPADHYEALVAKVVTPETDWIDVGGGTALFPSNPALSRLLSERARRLVVVDPSDDVASNPFAHERVKCLIEEYHATDRFDLATLRMVAEHIKNPLSAVRGLNRLLRPQGLVIVFTVNRWSPTTVVSSLLPFWLHHPIKRLFWEAEKKDTFPTEYKMNTQRRLRTLFSDSGFEERSFVYLDDLSVFSRFKFTNYFELVAWRTVKLFHLRYPQNCLLGVYEKTRALS
jgi:SAM-dependent methyltransferase